MLVRLPFSLALSSPASPLIPLASSLGCMLGILLPCSSRYFLAPSLHPWDTGGMGLVCGMEDRELLSKEPAKPWPCIHHQFRQSSHPLSRNHVGLSHLWVDFSQCLLDNPMVWSVPLQHPSLHHATLWFSKIRIWHDTCNVMRVVISGVDSSEPIRCHSFPFVYLFFTQGNKKWLFFLWVSQSLMDWLGSISLEVVGLKIPALFEEEEKSLMLNAPLLFQARDMLRQCCLFQNRGTWKKNCSSGKWINSESYMVHIEVGLNFLKAVEIDMNSPWLWLVTARLHKNITRCKGKK